METINFVVTVDQEYSFGQIKDEYVLNLLRTDNVEELTSFVVRHIIGNNIIAYTFSGPMGIVRKICNKIKNQKYTAKLKINNNRIIEVEGLKGLFKCEVMNCDFISENEETDKQDCCDECLLDDQELTKDLMLDEVISSQHREIERLMNIVQDLITTNLKLVEIIGLEK